MESHRQLTGSTALQPQPTHGFSPAFLLMQPERAEFGAPLSDYKGTRVSCHQLVTGRGVYERNYAPPNLFVEVLFKKISPCFRIQLLLNEVLQTMVEEIDQ